ncbi:4'-phosphopantetheinyl transferase family protein [Microbulbifer thermotolerans]|uniref:4'-phosphopantetheinyl transferase family protein n=1 Tax=Microbulbifer thermotolerans TaxID=252514 RepID=UPI0022490A2E|nr:4'-phosphopantetheinyl transferase superfamily protein [Microbulbifer thermotolerans]MCX2832748.1 4'-phosphopantetheinyl transferase superfamily protein [Microbulbifer thermotolerans]
MTDSAAPAFISDVHKAFDVDTQIVTVSCKFDVSLFQPADYAVLNLLMPASIAASVRKRQAEFLAGRYAASLALAALDIDVRACGPVGIGPRRNPVWPQGVVASISHAAGRAVCAASLRAHNDFLGVDIELLSPEMDCADVQQAVMGERELALLVDAGLAPSQAVFLTFSAKESLFKALYPAVGDYFGFEVASVTGCNPRAGRLSLTLAGWFADKHQLPVHYQCRYWLEADGGPAARIKTLIAGCYSTTA